MKVVAVALALPALTLAACVSNSNSCPSGFDYVVSSDYCAAIDASIAPAKDAASPSIDSGAPALGEAGVVDGGPGGEGGGSTGLGDSCQSASDCTGSANYCLISPAAPSGPGICSITPCTSAAECTSAYACCDCTHASLPALQGYPPNVCIKAASEAQAVALGCTCL